ncbi:response regulator [Fibrivirga algicola]|uniref:histidine kinase n=1 Tax=Fibrivirga algicola TaxID=2950420 RepID=A0ABX0QEV9_9BACT|nr:response regulator [Fibrivirga algicola]NID09273.1 response regulator [Fibrivirga algicola]
MILIVDDRRENILPLQKILELHRFQVDTAESGEEALRKVLNTAYSVIILDVQMPDMDGFEVASAISGFGKARDTSIIFLSAVNTEKRFITRGYTAGGIDYLIKPVDPDILVLKVKTLQKLYEQQQELRAAQQLLREEVEVRKQAQAALATQVEDLQKVLASIPLMAFTVRPDGQLEYVNAHWLSYATSDTTFPEAHPHDQFHEQWQAALASGHECTCEVRLRERATGQYRYHLLRALPIRKQDTIVRWIGTFTDIHAQKQATERLEQEVAQRTHELVLNNAELERANHELQQFTWVVSHDLKEPLRKIQFLNDLIKEQCLPESTDVITYLDRSIRASARMTNLINDLLAYAQLSAPEPFQPTDLNVLVNDLLLDFDETISRRHATVTIEPLPVIDAIPPRIRQVFQNLIGNALKFTRPATPPVVRIYAERVTDKTMDAVPDPTGPYCRIVVEDNGIGFDEKFSNRIFVLFQRLHDKTSFEGTGIGLAIAKKNIDKHHGLIAARSREGEGARFILLLPVSQSIQVPATLTL